MSKESKDILKQYGLKVYDRSKDHRLTRKILYISLRDMRFSRETGAWIGIDKPGSKLVFFELDGWYMALDSENENGFHVHFETKNRSGCRMCAATMQRTLLTLIAPGKNEVELGIELSHRFEYKGRPVYKLIKPEK